ncbi:MAG: PAS domain S-box protein [Roseiflexaceae bacterium]|nr:PAS domain S-box protein [Roseiflexaceae bacterium]
MNTLLHIIIVEDQPSDAELVLDELRKAGYAPVWRRVETEAEYLATLDPAFDLILADYSLPQFNALRALELLLAYGLDIPFIIVSGTIGEEVAVAAMRLGAADYLFKDRLARLGTAVAHALEQRQLRFEAQQASTALEASARLNQAVLRSLNAEIAVLDPTGTILAVNDAWEHFARTNGDPMLKVTGVGVNYLDVCRHAAMHSRDTQAALTLAGIQALIDGVQSHFTLEYGCQTPTELLWFVLQAMPLADQRGVVVAHEDITERKRAEQALQESEARYRLITENTHDLISMTDQDGHFIYVSPSYQPVLGYDPPTLIGRSAIDLVHGDDQIAMQHATHQIRNTDAAQATQRWHHADGSWRWIEVQITTAVQQGMAYWVAIGRDITERKRIEAQFFQSQKMESIGQLAGGIAHDFNNMLSVVIGFIGSAQEDLPHDSPAQRALKIAEESAWRGARLTRQLLTFARKQIVELRVLNLNTVIVDLNNMLRRLIGEDIELVTLLASDLGYVKADIGQLEQVITNLVVNARDAMPNGGKLIVKTSTIVLEGTTAQQQNLPTGRYVVLAISDTGSGMDSEVLQHIFEPFFTTKEVGKGTGLGLATCYSIVKQHSGAIQVDSAIGHGTTFTIYLACVEATAAIVQSAEPAGAPRGTETVLLVEDEPLVRELERAILNEQGYIVLEATNGEEAWRIVQAPGKAAITLLITDLVMPQMGGKALAELVLEHYPSIMVLFVSGYTIDAIDHTHAEMNFLAKPFTRETFARKVREILDS